MSMLRRALKKIRASLRLFCHRSRSTSIGNDRSKPNFGMKTSGLSAHSRDRGGLSAIRPLLLSNVRVAGDPGAMRPLALRLPPIGLLFSDQLEFTSKLTPTNEL